MNTHNVCAALLHSCAAIQAHVAKLSTTRSSSIPASSELLRAAALATQSTVILEKLALQSTEYDHKKQQSADTMYLADALNEMLGAYRDVYGRMPWERGD